MLIEGELKLPKRSSTDRGWPGAISCWLTLFDGVEDEVIDAIAGSKNSFEVFAGNVSLSFVANFSILQKSLNIKQT